MTTHPGASAPLSWARVTPLAATERSSVRTLRLALLTLATFADAGGRVTNPDELAPALERILEADERTVRAVLHDLEAAGLVELERANGARRRPTAATLTGKPWGTFGVHGVRMSAARAS